MKIILFLLLLIPGFSYSQLIKSNQLDSITKQRRIVTKDVGVLAAVSFKNGLQSITFNTINKNIYIVLHGKGKDAGTILQDDIAFLFTEKDTITIKSIGVQTCYGREEPLFFDHQYSITKDDLIKLSKNKLTSVRRFTSIGIFDLPINARYQGDIIEVCIALLKEMN